MEPEWCEYLRENAPARLYEEMQRDVKWAAEWRDNRIKELEAKLRELGVEP